MTIEDVLVQINLIRSRVAVAKYGSLARIGLELQLIKAYELYVDLTVALWDANTKKERVA